MEVTKWLKPLGIRQLYDVECEIKTLKPEERLKIRQARSKPLAMKFHAWMLLQRQRITDGNQAKMHAAWHESNPKVATKQIEAGGRLN